MNLDIRFEDRPDRLSIYERAEADLITNLSNLYMPSDTDDAVLDKVLVDKMGNIQKLPLDALDENVSPEAYKEAIDST